MMMIIREMMTVSESVGVCINHWYVLVEQHHARIQLIERGSEDLVRCNQKRESISNIDFSDLSGTMS